MRTYTYPAAVIDFAKSLRAARENCGMDRQTLAEMSGISERNISMVETGKADPTLSAMFQFADAMACRLRITFEPLDGAED